MRPPFLIICQKSLTLFLSSRKCSYTSILFAGIEYYAYLCRAFRIRGNGRPTSERKMPTVSTAMCDERESGKRAALLLPLFLRKADFLFITMQIMSLSSTKPPKLHIA